MNIASRLLQLRELMKDNCIDAYLITGTDPHLSEYTPDYWKTREWITGFTGSYGKVLVTPAKVLLWTDTRYFIQAREETKGTEIVLMKERVPNAVLLDEWLTENLRPGDKVGVDGLTISAYDAALLSSKLTAKGILFDAETDLVGKLWLNRKATNDLQIYEHPIAYAGKSRSAKIDTVRKRLKSMLLDATIITMLDDLAWLFNIRSTEILFTPLVTAYGYLDQESVCLAIHPDKVAQPLREIFENEGIKIIPYEQFYHFLEEIQNKRILVDLVRTNSRIRQLLSTSNYLDASVSLITQIKAIKDPREIEHIRAAHLKDGVAMVNFLFWITQIIGKQIITEISVGNKLHEYRAQQPHFRGDSFHPIIGFGAHGAIVHYHATNLTDFEICKDNILLIDSGGQYLDGTTDITRTICLGNATVKQKKDFTLCLKAHIALAKAVFPVGTKGYSLDSITRKPLWDNGIDYGHGTGHGIGYFLSVHEGPMSIRPDSNTEPIKEGQIMSNEPGIYRVEEYGIRIENVILCKAHSSGEFGDFLCFETLSLCPIAKNLIVLELLSKEEIKWINEYHEKVVQSLSPFITATEIVNWLKLQCAPLNE